MARLYMLDSFITVIYWKSVDDWKSQDKEEPPIEGRLPDATKGGFEHSLFWQFCLYLERVNSFS